MLLFLVGVSTAAIKGPQYNSIRSMGMGNTSIAITTDRTAIFHNPAGLSLLTSDIDISLSPVSTAVDGKLITILKALKEHGGSLNDIANIGPDFIDMLYDLDGQWVGLNYIPEATVVTRNLGFGIYSIIPVSVRIESGHFIPKLALRGQRDLVFTWAVGIPLRQNNNRCGISVEYIQRTPLQETITKYSETFIYFDKISSGGALGVIGDFSEVKHGVSFDAGFIHDFKRFEGFRLAYNVNDVLGVIGGKMIIPPKVSFGCAYLFPQVKDIALINNLCVALEFEDLFGIEPVSEKYEHFAKKIHAGTELELKYEMFRTAIRLGINQGYFTSGLGLGLGIFSMDYAFFTEELGYFPGQLPNQRHILSMSFQISIPRTTDEDNDKDTEPQNESLAPPATSVQEQSPQTTQTPETKQPQPAKKENAPPPSSPLPPDTQGPSEKENTENNSVNEPNNNSDINIETTEEDFNINTNESKSDSTNSNADSNAENESIGWE